LHLLIPIKQILLSPYNYIGILLILFGTIINIWTDNLFKKAGTTVKPKLLPKYFITKGPFKISRHPMYLGMAAVLFGESILLGSLIAFAFPIIFIILMEILFIPIEEKNLQKKFGRKYLNYKKTVRRWI
jgi:protein-S-isoprenylcysteine O-methyltransferase Ste14